MLTNNKEAIQMTNFKVERTEGKITVTEGYGILEVLVADVTEGLELGEITSVTFGYEGYQPITAERANEIAKAPISQVFGIDTPEEVSDHTAIWLIDYARFVLAKERFGKPNFVAMDHPESSRLYFEEIKVGMGGFYSSWTDRYHCVVTKVSPTGKQITVEDVATTAGEDFDYHSNQTYNFDPTPRGNAQKAYKGKYGYKNASLRFYFTGFSKYDDPSF